MEKTKKITISLKDKTSKASPKKDKRLDGVKLFARKFRWTLEGDHLPNICIKKISDLDYINRQISFEAYEIIVDGKNPAAKWMEEMLANRLPKETLCLKTYDGFGNTLDAINFEGLTLVSAKSDFDYESSDATTIRFTLGFSKHTRLTPRRNFS